MRVAIASVCLLLAVAGCQRRAAPAMPAPPVAATSAPLPMPAVELAQDANPSAAGNAASGSKKKPAPAVLAPIVERGSGAGTANRGNVGERDDPCAGMDDRALDDCLAREDAGSSPNDRPELEPRDRQLIEDEEAGARGRDRIDDPEDPSAEVDAEGPPDDYSSDEDGPDEDGPPEDYPPDEDTDEPPPGEPYPR
jgi:hypothetical protein